MPKGTSFGILLAGVACMLLLSTAVQGAESEKAKERTKVVILVGGHGYDERGFGELWSSFDDIASEVAQRTGERLERVRQDVQEALSALGERGMLE